MAHNNPNNPLKRDLGVPMTPVKQDKIMKGCNVVGGKDGVSQNSGSSGAVVSNLTILEELRAIKQGQDSLKTSLLQRIDNMRAELSDIMNKKFQALKDEFAMDITRLDNKLDELDFRIKRNTPSLPIQAFDIERTIVAIGLPYSVTEDLSEKVSKLVDAIRENPPPDADGHLSNAQIQNVLRMPERPDGKHPIVKIEFACKEQKIAVLRNKGALRNVNAYKRVFLRTSKSHAERMMENNLYTVLNMIPDAKNKFYFR